MNSDGNFMTTSFSYWWHPSVNLNHLQSIPGYDHQSIAKAHSYTDSAINDIRKLSHRLAPSNMEETPLEDAMHKLLQSINTNDQYEINFRHSNLP